MNHIQHLETLNNQYLVLRHGESIANQKALIVSSPDNGITNYGLTQKGKKQVEASIIKSNLMQSITHIISSDFLRTAETAMIAHRLLSPNTDIQYSKNLRERFFGNYELQDNSNYQNVWDNDQLDSSHTINNIESVDSVMHRTSSLISSLEKDFKESVILLVSHGDSLQILQTAFNKIPSSSHRSLSSLQTAELRIMTLQPNLC